MRRARIAATARRSRALAHLSGEDRGRAVDHAERVGAMGDGDPEPGQSAEGRNGEDDADQEPGRLRAGHRAR